LRSKRSNVESQVNKALGTTVPLKKVKPIVSVSAVALSELIVKVSDFVPPIVVEAAEMLLATNWSTYTSSQ